MSKKLRGFVKDKLTKIALTKAARLAVEGSMYTASGSPDDVLKMGGMSAGRGE